MRHRVLRFEQSKYELVMGALRLKAARLAELDSFRLRGPHLPILGHGRR